MRLIALLIIGIIAIGGAVDACADAHPEHGDIACLDDCCQPVYSAGLGPAPTAALSVCERLKGVGGCLNDDPLARFHFRPPKAG